MINQGAAAGYSLVKLFSWERKGAVFSTVEYYSITLILTTFKVNIFK